jgi:hypothetical protein
MGSEASRVLALQSVHRLAATIALAVSGALPFPACAETELALQAEVGAGIDSNPDRLAGSSSPSQEFLLALVRARSTLEGDRSRLLADITGGARLYPGLPAANALASRLDVSGQVALVPALAGSAALMASDLTERRHQLDQDMLRASAALAFVPGPWRVSVSGGWMLFAPRDLPLSAFEASGPEASLRLSWSPAIEHTLSTGYGQWRPEYPRWWEISPLARSDMAQTVSVEYAHEGNFLAAAGYAYAWNTSSVPGGAFQRHRITARAAAYIGNFTVALLATVQMSHYPQPLYLQQQLLLAQGNENGIEARLTYPLGQELEVALACALYRSETVQGAPAPSFSRALISVSVAWRGSRRSPRRARHRVASRHAIKARRV